MPQQLIYTSAPQGVDVGRSGYCTVARSSTMGESLVQRLEQFSYYERLSEHGGQAERTVFIFRNIDIRGKAYHVLSRIKDAPADYTGRTNFIAQHLVFTPNEVANMPTPAVLLNHWSGWKDNWEQEPRLFENESWAELEELTKRTCLPAKHWLSETADAGRAAGLLGLNAGVFTAHDFNPNLILELLSESLELLQLEGPNWRSLAWQRTFSVGCQPQDNPADFRWRFLTSGLPFESSVTQGRAPVELRRLRASSNSQQVQFAQKGPSPPQFMHLPRAGEAVKINEGETLILDGEALSLPGPSIYRWYRVEKDNVTLLEIDGAHDAKLESRNIPRGKLRYKVRAWDAVTDQYAESPVIVVEVKETVKISSQSGRPASTAVSVSPSSGASKPVSQHPRKKLSTYSSRTSDSSLGAELAEEVSPRFYRAHANTILIASVLFSLAGLTAAFLYLMDFFEPHFKDHKREWWALKINKDPLFFEESLRVTAETKEYIASYRKTTRNPKDKSDYRDYVLVWIGKDLIKHETGTPVRSDSPSKGEARPLEPVNSQPKTSDKPVPKKPVEKVSGPIHVILADPEWNKLIKLLDARLDTLKRELEQAETRRQKAEEQLAKIKAPAGSEKPKNVAANAINNRELEKANDEHTKAANAVAVAVTECENKKTRIASFDSTERIPLLNRRKSAAQLQHHNPWPYFPTDITPTPTLQWSEIGQKLPESGNRVSGEWRTNDWNFVTDNWSLQVSQSGAVYRPTKQTNSIHVAISNDENSNGTAPTLRLLLFSSSINKQLQATLDGDDLIPSLDLKTLLDDLDIKRNLLRIYGSYGHIRSPINYNVEEVDKHGPWKLGVTRQLIAESERAERLESVQKAFQRLDVFWMQVRKSTPNHLREKTFTEAVGDGKSKEPFWKQLNRLCIVAIFQKTDDQKTPKLEEKDGEAAWNKIQEYMGKEGTDGSKYQAELQTLSKDLKHFKDFWDIVYAEQGGANTRLESYKGKSYSAARETLLKEIRTLQEHGNRIDPVKLRVDLQFKAWGTNWFTITRL